MLKTFGNNAKGNTNNAYSKLDMKNGFIIDIGNSYTYAIPLMEGRVLFNEIRRINLGTANILDS